MYQKQFPFINPKLTKFNQLLLLLLDKEDMLKSEEL